MFKFHIWNEWKIQWRAQLLRGFGEKNAFALENKLGIFFNCFVLHNADYLISTPSKFKMHVSERFKVNIELHASIKTLAIRSTLISAHSLLRNLLEKVKLVWNLQKNKRFFNFVVVFIWFKSRCDENLSIHPKFAEIVVHLSTPGVSAILFVKSKKWRCSCIFWRFLSCDHFVYGIRSWNV